MRVMDDGGVGDEALEEGNEDQALFLPGRSPLTVVELTPATLDDRLRAWRLAHPTWAVVRLRGRRCRETPGLFAEAAAALQFPSWFGENWDAFADCLSDLSWLPARGYLLVLDGADQLLAGNPQDLETLRAVLVETAEVWADHQAALPDGTAGPVPFSSLLVSPPGTGAATVRRLAL